MTSVQARHGLLVDLKNTGITGDLLQNIGDTGKNIGDTKHGIGTFTDIKVGLRR